MLGFNNVPARKSKREGVLRHTVSGESSGAFEDISTAIAELTESLTSVVGRSRAAAPGEMEVWPLYALAEKTVAKMKLRLGVERPGVLSEIPRSKVPSEFLEAALKSLRAAGSQVSEGELVVALESLRSARTFLRAYLAELARVRSRQARMAARSSRSSSPSS